MSNEDLGALPTEEEKLIPLCCWCEAPLVLENRIAWCSGSEDCRRKQLSCAVTIDHGTHTEYLFVPSPRQTDVMMAQETNVFVCGNRGGGKSVCMRWLCHAMAAAIPGFKYIILRTSFPELQKNHLDFLEDEMNRLGGESEGFRYNKTEHTCRYPNGAIGYYAQCANDADVKKVLGAEAGMVVFDEAPTFQWDHMRLIAGSVRVPEGSGLRPMVRYLGNPIGDSIDTLWSYFVDRDVDLKLDPEYRPKDWRFIEMRIQDNPHLNAKQYWKQFSGLPAHIIKAWREGIRVDEDALFDFYPTKEGLPYHVVREIPRFGDGTPLFTIENGVYTFPDWVHIYRSIDWGFHPDPAVCLWFAVYGRRILCFKEITKNRMLAEDFAELILEESQGMRVVATYCDPSMDIEGGHDVYTIKQKMENAGVPIDCMVNDRELFADALHTLLSDQISETIPRTQFLDGHCPMTIKAIPRMKYDHKKPAAMAAHKLDHWPVAVGYFGQTMIPTTTMKSTKVLKRYMIPKKAKSASMARLIERQQARLRGLHPSARR